MNIELYKKLDKLADILAEYTEQGYKFVVKYGLEHPEPDPGPERTEFMLVNRIYPDREYDGSLWSINLDQMIQPWEYDGESSRLVRQYAGDINWMIRAEDFDKDNNGPVGWKFESMITLYGGEDCPNGATDFSRTVLDVYMVEEPIPSYHVPAYRIECEGQDGAGRKAKAFLDIFPIKPVDKLKSLD